MISEDNRRVLRSRGNVIYLSASAEQLSRRTSKDKNRPLLQTENPQQQIVDLLAERGPLYESVADIELRTGEQSISHAVTQAITLLENVGK